MRRVQPYHYPSVITLYLIGRDLGKNALSSSRCPDGHVAVRKERLWCRRIFAEAYFKEHSERR